VPHHPDVSFVALNGGRRVVASVRLTPVKVAVPDLIDAMERALAA